MLSISAYILTKNSEKYLHQILTQLVKVADEILIIDSGSTDKTEAIATNFEKVKFIYHEFQDFKSQRYFAETACTFDAVLFLDSDEIPNDDFLQNITKVKQQGIQYDAYRVKRYWYAFGQKVENIYPIMSPDRPIRFYDRRRASFKFSKQYIHESPDGFETLGVLDGRIEHYTFETKEELDRKLESYTDLAAKQLIKKGKSTHFLKRLINPSAAFIKWYLLRKGYKDGKVGWILGKYAFNYTLLKYQKAKFINIKDVEN